MEAGLTDTLYDMDLIERLALDKAHDLGSQDPNEGRNKGGDERTS